MIKLNDIYPAIQGEGCLAGAPMIIIRTMGCGVGCPWCDTKETWVARKDDEIKGFPELVRRKPAWGLFDEVEIARHATEIGPNISWALVTGGEPADQRLDRLVAALHSQGFRAAIETSGTALGHIGAGFDWVCLSPKIDMPGGLPFLPETLASADEIKYVIGKQDDIDHLRALIADAPLKPGAQVCLQPVSQSPKATELCYQVCLKTGWRLSLQIHKYLEKP